jgi:peptidoglycan/xylan/chitin deacetylase (PgdA/CDA1 family)
MERSDDRSLSLTLALTAALAGLHAGPALAAPLPFVRRWLGVDDRVRAERGVALTFDDGPHPEGTPAVLKLLSERDLRATFFLVGERVRANPRVAGEIVAAGHQVGLHCDRHRNLLRLTPWQVQDDLERAVAAIEQATGRSPALYRPPYGVFNLAALRWSRRHQLRPLLWTHWGRDWEARATPASIAERVTAGVEDRSVLLLHDADDYSAPGSWRRTAQALPSVLDELERRELEVVDP